MIRIYNVQGFLSVKYTLSIRYGPRIFLLAKVNVYAFIHYNQLKNAMINMLVNSSARLLDFIDNNYDTGCTITK